MSLIWEIWSEKKAKNGTYIKKITKNNHELHHYLETIETRKYENIFKNCQHVYPRHKGHCDNTKQVPICHYKTVLKFNMKVCQMGWAGALSSGII